MVFEMAAMAWLGEWVTVTVAGAVLHGIQTQLQPDEMQQVLKHATQAANQQAHDLFAACPPDGRKGVQSFLRQFFETGEVRSELQKPLQDRGRPSVDVLVLAFEQQASAHSTIKNYKPQFLQSWMEEFVEDYFEQIQGIRFQVARKQYLKALVNSCDDIKFVGIDAAVRERDRSAKLLDIFVVPNVVTEIDSKPEQALLMQQMPEALEVDQAELWLEQQQRLWCERGTTASAHQLLARNRQKVVLLGEPGSGKTTLMRYFAVKLARNEAADIGLTQGEDWFPILIYLRDWAKQPEQSLIAQLEDFAANTLHVELPVGFFQHWLQGRSLILLDGLDEVIDEATRSQLVGKLECALEDSQNAVVITSRPWGYNRAYFRTETFPHFELEKFNEKQIQQFIQNWYESRHENSAAAQSMIANLQESLEANDRVKQLVKNPLLLTIVVLIHRFQDVLPKRRHQLYDKAVNTLLKSWDRTAKGLREQQKEFFKVLDIDDDLRRIMALLARWIHEQYATKTTEGGTIIREKDLLQQLSEIIQSEHDIKSYKADEEAKRFVEFIRDRTGLINEYGRGLYAFVHKSFQEYLTAEAIQSEARYDFGKILTFIRTHLHQQHWREVILLLVSQQEEEGAAKAIEAILQAGSEYEHWLHRDLLLAGICLVEDPPRLWKANRSIVEGILDELVCLVTCDSEVSGYQLQQRAQRLLCRLRNTEFQALALEKIEAQGDAIKRFDLLQYQFYLGKKETATTELLTLLKDPNPNIRWDAVNMLGQLMQGVAEAVAALLPLLKDPDSDVRGSAADVLGQVGQGSTEVVTALLPLLQHPDSDVRKGAADALGQIGQSSTDVVTALLPLLHDQDLDVFRSTTNAFKKLGQESAEVMAVLTSLLQDQDLNVRGRAVDALGELGWGSVEVVAALLPLLEAAESSMRGRVAYALGKLGQGSAEVVAALLPLLQDPTSFVRGSVAYALRESGQGSAEVVAALLPLLQDPTSFVRLFTVYALEQLGQGSAEAVAALLPLLQDSETGVCKQVAYALAELGQGSAEVVAALLPLLQDSGADVRSSAAFALGRLEQGAVEVATALLPLLQDPEASVRNSAAFALGKMGKHDHSVRTELVQWMAQQPAEAKLGEAIAALNSIMDS